MQLRIGLASLALAFRAIAQDTSVILPHVDAGGLVSWTATIDATTVKRFVDTGEVIDGGVRQREALNHWLDDRLAAVPWCGHGWHYRLEEKDKYIEPLDDGRLRVRGICNAASH